MKDVQKEHIEKLENVVKQIVSPLKVLPPEKVLELIYDNELNSPKDKRSLTIKNKRSKNDG